MDVFANRTRSRPVAAAAALGLVALFAAACGPGEGDATPEGQDPPIVTTPGEQGEMSLTVTTPSEGDSVTVPFEVSVDSGTELGTMAEQLNHLHIWFGDTTGQPLIVESDTTMIEDAPNGDTTMIVQVHTFDHQPASDQVSVPLVVQGGSDGEPSAPPGNDY
jgi:hypothetical protein